MSDVKRTPITIEAVVDAPLADVWNYWNAPEHIVGWAFASDDWEASNPENDLRTGGVFKTTMGAKDKSAEFDFGGVYTDVQEHEIIEYVMSDGRTVRSTFVETPDGVLVTQTFDPEGEYPEEYQKEGWQAILDNFKKYAEAA